MTTAQQNAINRILSRNGRRMMEVHDIRLTDDGVVIEFDDGATIRVRLSRHGARQL